MAVETAAITKKESKKDTLKANEAPRQHVAVDDDLSVEAEQASPKSNKRKREAPNSELEIDLSLPEPPSKKALRKAKRHESTSKHAASKADPNPELPTSPTSPTTDSKNSRRSNFAIWIGNLPWHATKSDLRTFITTHAPSISDSHITRIHMPIPDAPSHRMYRNGQKPSNKGFAYVDFDSPDALEAALKLTELEFEQSGRKVLVKNAASFEGRPVAGDGKHEEGRLDGSNDVQKPVGKRVFVGNLAFDVTREDLETHYAQCGQVVDVHVATFEDSGKCKGFAWVTFDSVDAGEAAARGYVWKEQDDEDSEGEDEKGRVKKRKPIKWWVNRLNGRDLRVEFAEDASFRYKKRFGSEAKNNKKKFEWSESEDAIKGPVEEVIDPKSGKEVKSSHERRREVRKSAKDTRAKPQPKVVINSAKIGGTIVEGQGKKITFD
jgi:RNA recognition motif-containing protein